MAWWIEIRHAESSSPIHPTRYEKKEGARLYLNEKKAAYARREMSQGDLVFLYETASNPRNPKCSGASAIGALVIVDSPPYHLHDEHRNALTGDDEDWKVDASWVMSLRDWTHGVSLAQLRQFLNNSPRWAPRSLMRIDQDAYQRIHDALRESVTSERASVRGMLRVFLNRLRALVGLRDP